jgi:hypothetical protein
VTTPRQYFLYNCSTIFFSMFYIWDIERLPEHMKNGAFDIEKAHMSRK